MPLPALEGNVDHLTKVLNELVTYARGRKSVFGVPIPWSAEPVFVWGSVVSPAATGAGSQLVVCSYTVPRGMYAMICGVVLGFVGGAIPNPNDFVYTIDVDTPLGSTDEGYTEKDYAAVGVQLGSLVPCGPWPVEFKHSEEEMIQIKAFNNSGPAGAGNFLQAALVGFQWPDQGWEK